MQSSKQSGGLLTAILILTTVVAALADPPDYWTVDPAAFEHFMTITGVITINAQLSVDNNDLVAAFVGDQCRGLGFASAAAADWRYFLMVRANGSGEIVTFRVWDADQDTVLAVISQIQFVADDAIGTVATPHIFDAVNTIVGLTTGSAVPRRFGLEQNYPNPFNPATTITYMVEEPARISLGVYDLRGRLVRQLLEGFEDSGWKSVVWDGCDQQGHFASGGVYLARLSLGARSQTIKMILLK
ncbi:MAG: T9SS type A sorting domain-containing protein [Candidatus Neomarinimicrobiota bacterium]